MRGRPFKKGESGNPGGRPKVIAELRELARVHAPDAIEELARLAVKAKSETARVAAIRELLDKATQVLESENEVRLDDISAEELRAKLPAQFAAAFPNYRLVPIKPPNSLAPKRRRLNAALRAVR
jgi:hypothetical protein